MTTVAPRIETSPIRHLRPRIGSAERPHVHEAPDEGIATARRAVIVLAAASVFVPLAKTWANVLVAPAAALAAVPLTVGALLVVVLAATDRTVPEARRTERWVLVVAAASVLAYGASMLIATSHYWSDESALQQGAAQLLLHGHDPYGQNLLSSLFGFQVPATMDTYTVSGGLVTTFGYPAAPLWLVAPFVGLTGGGQAVPIAYMLVLVAGMVLTFRLLPDEVRAAAIVAFVGIDVMAMLALAGMTELLAVVALIPLAARWTQIGFGDTSRSAVRWTAVGLGVATASSQLAWLIAPFAICGIFLIRAGVAGRRSAVRAVGTMVGCAGAAFLIVNLPFLVANPRTWLDGVLAPITQHALPFGQGLVALTIFGRIGGGAPSLLTPAAGCALIGAFVLYVLQFRRIAGACFVMPLFAVLLAGRSLGSYWFAPIPLMLLSVVCSRRDAAERALRFAPRVLRRVPGSAQGAVLCLPALALVTVSLLTPAPLVMKVRSETAEPSTGEVYALNVWVRNRSGDDLTPHFSTDTTGMSTGFWRVTKGPATLRAHTSADYVITSMSSLNNQPLGSSLTVHAVTSSPETVSTTPPVTTVRVILRER